MACAPSARAIERGCLVKLDELKAAAETLERELPVKVSGTEILNADGLVLACVYGPYEACSDPVHASAFAFSANALPGLLAEAEALAWCREHLADVEFNDFGDGALVRVKYPVNLDADEWREATAPTFVEAIADLRKLEGEKHAEQE